MADVADINTHRPTGEPTLLLKAETISGLRCRVSLTRELKTRGSVQFAIVLADIIRHAEAMAGWDPEDVLRVVTAEIEEPTSPLTMKFNE